jgi:hypothetical protein
MSRSHPSALQRAALLPFYLGEFMIMTCELCGNDFLTEADPYVVRNTHQGQKYYCSCMISNHDQISGIDKLQAENKKLRKIIHDLVTTGMDSDIATRLEDIDEE